MCGTDTFLQRLHLRTQPISRLVALACLEDGLFGLYLSLLDASDYLGHGLGYLLACRSDTVDLPVLLRCTIMQVTGGDFQFTGSEAAFLGTIPHYTLQLFIPPSQLIEPCNHRVTLHTFGFKQPERLFAMQRFKKLDLVMAIKLYCL